jgi:hypothetical protein
VPPGYKGLITGIIALFFGFFFLGYYTAQGRVERESKSADTRLGELTAENSRLNRQLQQQTASASAINASVIAGLDRCEELAGGARQALAAVGAGLGGTAEGIRATARGLVGVAQEVKNLEMELNNLRASLSCGGSVDRN